MKSIEEKAKAYDEALERAKKVLNCVATDREHGTSICEYIFPELKESEDEKIRKALMEMIYDTPCIECEEIYKIPKEKCIAWLEKQRNTIPDECVFRPVDGCDIESAAKQAIKQQGVLAKEVVLAFNGAYIPIKGKAQDIIVNEYNAWLEKYADKVEQKFHEGDWVIYNNDICQIVKREEGCNILVTQFGVEKEPVNERNLSTAKLWGVSDAKDGDVLVGNKGDAILIFRGLGNEEWNDVIGYYCWYDCYQKKFIIQKDLEFYGYIKDNQLKPSTKEQRETLMKAMDDAGFKFDFEKKRNRGIIA